ncbi:MAG: GyrI-like domain-containing protein [Planctomycetaceae bacterium]
MSYDQAGATRDVFKLPCYKSLHTGVGSVGSHISQSNRTNPETACEGGQREAGVEENEEDQTKEIKMNFEIVEQPIQLHLYGVSGAVENERYGEVGMSLMNQMWQVVKDSRIPNTGINHWVYLPAGRMFVGVELLDSQQTATPDRLEPLEFELQRYLKHIHVGPYQALPQKWKDLKAELAARQEVIAALSVEIYGHHCEDPSRTETTILIGLQVKP